MSAFMQWGGRPDLRERVWLPELMDAPDGDAARLGRTLAQFRGINRLTARYRTLLTRIVLADMRRAPARAYHLVDVGAGGCDIPVWLLAQARRLGLRLRVTAVDSDPRAVAWARARHGTLPGLAIEAGQADAVSRYAPVDYVYANNFLHHLPDAAAMRRTLAGFADAAGRGYVVADIRRCRLAYVGVTLLTGLCFRGSFARVDGQLSVRKGFRPAELAAVAPPGARVVGLWPARLAVIGGAAAGGQASGWFIHGGQAVFALAGRRGNS